MKVRDLLREVPEAAKHGTHMLESPKENEEETPSQDERLSMREGDLILAFANGTKPFSKGKFQHGGTNAPPRNVADVTCPPIATTRVT